MHWPHFAFPSSLHFYTPTLLTLYLPTFAPVLPRGLFLLAPALLLAASLNAQVDSLAVEVPADSAAAPLLITAQPLQADTVAQAAAEVPKDSLDWRQRHSPKRAAIFSAVIPGAGQIYNRKYWKAPIVWAGLGVSAYFIRENTTEYRRYKDAYIAVTDGDATTIDEFNGQYSPESLLNVTETYRRWRDLSYIAIGAVYILNILDATVDAHFVRFDVSPDLSVGVGPSLEVAAQGGAGLTFSLAVR